MLHFLSSSSYQRAGVFALVAALAAFASGCTPQIGDKCVLNTDCSVQGTLQCDTSQPNGYCTFFDCAPDTCQNQATCVLFQAAIPGCPYDDYQAPARTGRTMCLKQCHKNSDCRESDGYICTHLVECNGGVCESLAPWHAQIVDDDQTQQVCILAPDYDAGPIASYLVEAGGVCSPSGPSVDASWEFPDAATDVEAPDAGAGDANAGGG